ncbi:hypothetical protein [Variovorax sp. WS11]|uniref:hypothetical protein n=1 Tax=Variovorax sp. WS11 TaxID=1105204 RepID=UPI0011B1E0F3|nr:hypothetical protein [Variovorax sp. WS11]NDZ15548.1 hypothetical protein [Variovorax sp. WS11]
MGEARRRGTAEQRVKEAIARDKAKLYRAMGINLTSPEDQALRTTLDAFLAHLDEGEWESRKSAIVERLETTKATTLWATRPIRDQQDEIGWYLMLAELALTDPLCQETNQAARTLPFLTAIGKALAHRERVERLDEKIKEVVGDFRHSPDGVLFEILVALTYAGHGWNVRAVSSPKRNTGVNELKLMAYESWPAFVRTPPAVCASCA